MPPVKKVNVTTKRRGKTHVLLSDSKVSDGHVLPRPKELREIDKDNTRRDREWETGNESRFVGSFWLGPEVSYPVVELRSRDSY